MIVYELIFAVPVVAIVMGIGAQIIKNFLAHQERKYKLKLESQSSASGSVTADIQALRDEVARLRDTSTQYDISIQHSLEDMQQRLEFLERRLGVAAVRIREEEERPIMSRAQ